MYNENNPNLFVHSPLHCATLELLLLLLRNGMRIEQSVHLGRSRRRSRIHVGIGVGRMLLGQMMMAIVAAMMCATRRRNEAGRAGRQRDVRFRAQLLMQLTSA